MKLKVSKSVGNVVRLEEGIYPAKFVDIEKREAGGREFFLWSFEIIYDGKPVTVNGMTSTKITAGARPSKAYNWLCAIVGRKIDVNEEIDTEALKGKEVMVVIENRQFRDTEVSRVTDVKKKAQTTQTKEQPKEQTKETKGKKSKQADSENDTVEV
jgi:hypothetical protein